MDFAYPPAAEALRAELRAWLDENLEPRFRGLGSVIAASPDGLEALREWNRRLADAGWVAIAWPREHGGRDAGVIEQVVWAEEMDRAQAPPLLNPIGLSNIAPSIMQFGTDAQKDRFLRRMRRGDDVWCQGFSEPDAGSDLASLRATAVRDGDHFVVNGQKVWNTLGSVADWCELLVRTDPEAPRHRGISCLLVDMTLPGIEVRPIVTITGEAEFAELFFTDVRVPADALLGPLHQGWSVAMTTLNNERGGVAALHLQVRRKIRQLIDEARRTPCGDGSAAADPGLRRELARLYVEGEHLKLLSDRALSGMIHGRAGPEGALTKLVWSQTEQQLAEVAARVLGPDALAGTWGRARLHSRSYSIAGGTTQVNKNIVAQRVLGLPRSY
jgi:alkylation response protein AidB-like acyl-CoA dehydrogenase